MDLAQCGEEITCNDHQGAVPDRCEKEEWFRAFGDAEWKNCGRRGIRCRNTTNKSKESHSLLGHDYLVMSSPSASHDHLMDR